MTRPRCYLCQSEKTFPLGEVFSFSADRKFPAGGSWFRCRACGSDTNVIEYSRRNYTTELSEMHAVNGGGPEKQEENVRYNCDVFDLYRGAVPELTFLDVGCCDGAALRVMQSRGWAIHGFEVFEPTYIGPHVTVSPVFSRWLFPRQYGAIMCREVFEHVVYPHMLMNELFHTCLPGGIVQLQTPLPMNDDSIQHVYQEPHLFIASNEQLRKMAESVGFHILYSNCLLWPGGQMLMLRRPS